MDEEGSSSPTFANGYFIFLHSSFSFGLETFLVWKLIESDC